MKRFLAILLMAALMTSFAFASENEEEWFFDGEELAVEGEWEDLEAFGFEPESEGYSGEWIHLEDLNMEFCLPDGWAIALTEEDVNFYAETSDGKGSIAVYVESDMELDLFAWADNNLEQYETDIASFYDVVLQSDNTRLYIYLINAEGKLIAFRFIFDAASPISREFALEVVGSAYEVWA